ncbi:MAG: translation elongation factor-like protein [Candidatus Bathyarchaeota archaeon]|nr:MAG: translation elongation factor-like protein [Candidatus Bathyarchaeota archaeon]
MSDEEFEKVGTISHFFAKIAVAVIDLSGTLSTGDRILIRGATTSLDQTVDSMQIDRVDIKAASAGQSVGLKVNDRVREGDIVYKING